MSVSFVNAGAVATGTTSISVAYPASIVADNLLIMTVISKLTDNIPPTPTGWIRHQGYISKSDIGAIGSLNGPLHTCMYTKIANGTETGNVTVEAPDPNATPSIQAVILQYTKTLTYWDIEAARGIQRSQTSPWSIILDRDPGIQADDLCVVGIGGSRRDIAFSSESLTVSGITFGVGSERIDSTNLNGHGTRLCVWEQAATSGTSSGVATFAATYTVRTGAIILLRLRDSNIEKTNYRFPYFLDASETVTSATSSISLSYPIAQLTSGDLILIGIASKRAAAIPITPDGWTLLDTHQAGSGADGTGQTGPTNITVFYKIADGTETPEDTAVTINFNTAVTYESAGRLLAYRHDSGYSFTLEAAHGDDISSASTTVSATMNSTLAIEGNEVVLSFTGYKCAVVTDAFSAHTLTASGVTIGTVGLELAEIRTLVGPAVTLIIADFNVLTGTATDVATYTMINVNPKSETGPTMLVRLKSSPIIDTGIQLLQGYSINYKFGIQGNSMKKVPGLIRKR